MASNKQITVHHVLEALKQIKTSNDNLLALFSGMTPTDVLAESGTQAPEKGVLLIDITPNPALKENCT